jgi:hypothetical protein
MIPVIYMIRSFIPRKLLYTPTIVSVFQIIEKLNTCFES